jgi:hypothetical protein
VQHNLLAGNIVDMLLTLGAVASLASNQGLTAQQWAAQLGHRAVADTLSQHAESEAAAAAVAEAASALADYHAGNDADRVDLKLIEQLLEYLCGEGRHTAQARAPLALFDFCLRRLYQSVASRTHLQRADCGYTQSCAGDSLSDSWHTSTGVDQHS